MHEPFIVADGRVLHTLHELVHALRVMSPEVFAHHVTPDRHDFAAWIAHSLRLPRLAEQVRQIREKEALIAVLEAYLLAQQQTQSPEEQAVWDEKADVARQERARQEGDQEYHHTHDREGEDGWISIEDMVTRKERQENQEDDRVRSDHRGSQQSGMKIKGEGTATLSKDTSQHIRDASAETSERYGEEEKGVDHSLTSLKHGQAEPAPPLPENTAHEDEQAYPEALRHYQQPIGAETISENEVKTYADIIHAMRKEIAKVYIGQTDVVKKILLALTCDAHALLEGVPGLAKSLLVETLGHIVKDASFKRIQFLPDMLPADVLGTEVFNPKSGDFRIVKGPIFANFVLADEINRAPPKTHAALMEAMQEKKVNIGDHQFVLDKPFLVLATQNPLEQKGTYSLPEAVLDRFMFKIILDYPLREHEKIILTENATVKRDIFASLKEVVSKETFLHMQRRVKDVYVSDRIREYILDLIEATRGKNKKIEGMKFVKYGAGPRAGIYLTIGAKAHALTQGRTFVLPEDVMYVAPDILRHRIFLNYTGKAYEISTDKIVEEILLKVNPL